MALYLIATPKAEETLFSLLIQIQKHFVFLLNLWHKLRHDNMGLNRARYHCATSADHTEVINKTSSCYAIYSSISLLLDVNSFSFRFCPVSAKASKAPGTSWPLRQFCHQSSRCPWLPVSWLCSFFSSYFWSRQLNGLLAPRVTLLACLPFLTPALISILKAYLQTCCIFNGFSW